MKISAIEIARCAFKGAGQCLVLPVFEKETPDSTLLAAHERQVLRDLAKRGVITGKAQDIHYLPAPAAPYGGVLLMGLGKRAQCDAEAVRRGAGAVCPVLKAQLAQRLTLDATHAPECTPEAFVEGILLGAYTFDAFKKAEDGKKTRPEITSIRIAVADKEQARRADEICQRAALICIGTNGMRHLANTPPNELTPEALATYARAAAAQCGCTCTVLGPRKMATLGMNALLGVAKGSARPPQLIIFRYEHKKARKTLALVGKGVTFDSGGISLKPGEGMHEMKFDMCGAAAVLGAALNIAELKPAINLVCVIPAVENMPGPGAQNPGDIVRAYNGVSIEVHNTDAEGRLILADAMAYTAKNFKPDAMLDVATLTGAAIIALGHYAAAVTTNNDALYAGLEAASRETGERIWRLPLWDDYRELVKGTHADICNIGPAKEAGTIVGGAFLERFTGDVPWAHLDIAGTAWGAKNIPYLDPKHASGYGVRLLTRWVLDQAGA